MGFVTLGVKFVTSAIYFLKRNFSCIDRYIFTSTSCFHFEQFLFKMNVLIAIQLP